MPIYTYACDSCDSLFEVLVKFAQRSDPQDCPECGEGPARRTISKVNFNLPGDGFPGKNNRIASQMRQKNQRLGAKRSERAKELVPTLVPNVDGERTGSWREAGKLAQSQGKDSTGYEKLAKKAETT